MSTHATSNQSSINVKALRTENTAKLCILFDQTELATLFDLKHNLVKFQIVLECPILCLRLLKSPKIKFLQLFWAAVFYSGKTKRTVQISFLQFEPWFDQIVFDLKHNLTKQIRVSVWNFQLEGAQTEPLK